MSMVLSELNCMKFSKLLNLY